MKLNNQEMQLFNKLDELLKESLAFQYVQHTKRVIDNCEIIGYKENADFSILIPAAILHDVGRCKDNSLSGHVDEGVLIARDLLVHNSYSEKQITDITLAIKEHHLDLPNGMPSTVEGRVLLDADRIEIVGSYGMARWFLAIDNTASPEDACQMWLGLSKRKATGKETFFCTVAGEDFGLERFAYSKNLCLEILNG